MAVFTGDEAESVHEEEKEEEKKQMLETGMTSVSKAKILEEKASPKSERKSSQPIVKSEPGQSETKQSRESDR